jgi:hypothetical protein
MTELKYRTVNVDQDTFEKLNLLAEHGYRNLSAEVRYLVDREIANLGLSVSEEGEG